MKKATKPIITTACWGAVFTFTAVSCLAQTITSVNAADYQPPFPLTAKLNKLTIKVDRPQLSPADIKKLEAGMQQAADAK
jgi:hypothetical protein